MAFDAGSIEATLTLNRNPFTAGLAAAKSQARAFSRQKIEATLGIKVDQRQLIQVEALLKRLGRQRVQATARVLVDRLQFNKLLTDLRRFDRTVYTTRVQVDAARATAEVLAFRTLLGTLNDQTVNLTARTRRFGGVAGTAFGGGRSHFARMAGLIIGTLPIMATGFTATVGALGAINSALIMASLGASAFSLVAIPAFMKVKDAVAAGQAEINKLPPGLREAGVALDSLLKQYDKLVVANQKITGLALASWFNAGTAALKTLNPLVEASARAFLDAGTQARIFFQSKWWQDFVQFLSTSVGPAVDMLFRSIFALIRIVGNLTRAFWDLGGSQIMQTIVQGLEKFALYTEKIGQNQTFRQFMESAVRSLPVVAELIGNLVVFIFKLSIGLEPLGTVIVKVFNGIFNAINQLPPETISAIAFAVAALMAALALGAGGPVSLGIAALAGLATIFANLYTENERLRTGINNFVADLQSRFMPIWQTIVDNFNNKIKPAWNELVAVVEGRLIPALEKFGSIIMDKVLPPLQGFIDTLTGKVIPSVLRFLEMMANVVSWLVETFGPAVGYVLEGVVRSFDGAFKMIAGLLDLFTGLFTGNWQLFLDGLYQIGEGFWTIIAGMFGLSLDELFTMFSQWGTNLSAWWTNFWNGIKGFVDYIWALIVTAIENPLETIRRATDNAAILIGQAWRKVANLFRDPINWVIRTVINPPTGLLGAWNAVMNWIGATGLGNVRLPEIPAFSRGGTNPGYGPRQDTMLAWTSPGESWMVPEWTRMMGGPGEVRKMNDAAMNGQYYEGSPRGYSLGGTVPHFAYGGVAPHVAAAGDEVTRVIGRMPGGIGGVGARANASDHPSGFALDFMTLNNVGLGNRVASYLTANWQRLAVKYLIWLQRIASRPGDWRPMADRGSRTANHMDHVHASFLGGPGGGAAPVPMVSWWSIIASKVTSLFKSIFGGDVPGVGGMIGEAIERIPGALIDKVIKAIQSKLEGMMTAAGSAVNEQATAFSSSGGFSTMTGADTGAVLAPGPNALFNATGKPETLTNLDIYEDMVRRRGNGGVSVEDVLAILREWDGGGSGDTYNVMLPPRATVRELADTIDFKRRVVAKGRYSR